MIREDDLFERLADSEFRSRFTLKDKDIQYMREKGMVKIRSHAADFIAGRLAPAYIPNDGKQTPMRGHPVFLAQHATGCCCRGCLQKWHHIEPGVPLTEEQQDYVVDVLMEWMERQLEMRGVKIGDEPMPREDKLSKKKHPADPEEGEYVQLRLPFV